MNDTDPAISLPNDQCVLAQNVEFTKSTLGERRQGTDAIDLTSSNLSGHDRVTFLHRHVPGTDETAAELWALGVTGTASATLARKTTAWSNPTIGDTVNLALAAQFAWRAVSFRGKLFLAYDSNVDRLHVWDGTSIRRTGLVEPAAPTAAEQGSGTFSGVRYYRIRYTEQVGGVTVRRSEPSDSVSYDPAVGGSNGSAARVTKPTTISEGETHWELEASVDNANFYVIATTVVGTTTYDDSTLYSTGYAQSFTLSEDTGDYSLIWSAKYLAVDEDRLVVAGSFEDSALASRVGWSPVHLDPGNGNNERIPLDTNNYNDLNGLEGGEVTGLSGPVNGSLYVFKYQHVYKMVRTGLRSRAYDIFCLTKARGALDGSVVEGVDAQGQPCVYFLDPKIGPCRAGMGGVKSCGKDITTTWQTVNLGATKAICRGYYYPDKKQVVWNFATGSADVPDRSIVLQTDQTEDTKEGVRRGWSVWTGKRSTAIAACLFSTNIDAGVARNRILKPLLGLEGNSLIHLSDTGDDDDGTEYSARIVTKPYAPNGILNHSGVLAGALLAKAVSTASIDVKAHRDYGLETKTVSGVSFTASASETDVIKFLDNFTFKELRTFQIEFVDVSTPGPRWELAQFAMKLTGGQKA